MANGASDGALDGKVLSCQWDIWISGTKLGVEKKQLITSITIKETVDGSDTATVNICDPDFQFIEDNIFKEKNPIKIKAGWSAYNFRFKFAGYISAVDIDFESDGVPKLTLTCMDKTFKMNKKVKSKTWKNKTTAQVVKAICKQYGFKCKTEGKYDFKKQKSISQKNQTDIEFIQKLAQDEVHPFTARLVGDTFHYEKKGKMSSPKMTLGYRKSPFDIISFSPKINKEEKEVKKGNTETKSKTANATTAGMQPSTSNGKVSGETKSNSSSSSGSSSGKTVSRNAESHSWK